MKTVAVLVLPVTLFTLINAQSITITNPLIGDEGGSLEIVCQAFNLNGGTVTPAFIIIQRNGVVFIDAKLSSISNNTHIVYTYDPLSRDDNGDVIQCLGGTLSSAAVGIQVNYSPVHTATAGENLVGSVLTLTEGESSVITVTIDANPAPTNTLGSSLPSSITLSNNMIMFTSVNRADAGEYNFTSTNIISPSATTQIILVVNYPPTFDSEVSTVFMCDASTTPITCAAMPGQDGSLNCQFESVPASTSFTVVGPDSQPMTNDNGSIAIVDASSDNAGNYECIATNEIGSATRNIIFYVGGVPMAVEIETPVVDFDNNRVTITWTHPTSNATVPATGFTLTGGPVDGTNDISQTVSPDIFSIELQADQLSPSAAYIIYVVAESLLGESARAAQFFTPEGPTTKASVPPITCNSAIAIAISTSVLINFPITLTIGFILGVLVMQCWTKFKTLSTETTKQSQSSIELKENEALCPQ